MYVRVYVFVSLGPVSYMRTEAPYPLEPLCFSGPTPAQLRLRFGTPTGHKYCATASIPEKSYTSDQVPVRHFMVPTIWSRDFSGRQEIMIRLENVLSESDKHCRVAIVGLGGVGKTRVMI
jgi:hypothetical protein